MRLRRDPRLRAPTPARPSELRHAQVYASANHTSRPQQGGRTQTDMLASSADSETASAGAPRGCLAGATRCGSKRGHSAPQGLVVQAGHERELVAAPWREARVVLAGLAARRGGSWHVWGCARPHAGREWVYEALGRVEAPHFLRRITRACASTRASRCPARRPARRPGDAASRRWPRGEHGARARAETAVETRKPLGLTMRGAGRARRRVSLARRGAGLRKRGRARLAQARQPGRFATGLSTTCRFLLTDLRV